MRKTYFLVHGAWTGSWCWEKLRPLLEVKGHTVIAPDMPGHGQDKAPIEEQNLEKYARAIEALIKPLDDSVILVGHSFGGMVASQATCYIPNKIKKLIYITAFLPRDGQSCVGITQTMKPSFHEKILATGNDFILSVNGKTSKIPLESCADFIYNDIPREKALILAERLSSESNAAQHQAAVLNDEFNNIPKVYVRCTLDKTVDINLQDKMIAETYCGEVYTLETGHCPFESNPHGLADILLSL